ncbi:TIM44-like domain-containing protein [Marinomonas mediterranea]|uniref:Import inner membrane translocase subunit Tim44 n=1 Tax=Marinomonas mediterranea (strain ATCC 700492 / JCM 21426 / NBRC 103028 / MMB-1) TaxID=717774 RepID=F2JZ42_MARM1|nr:Tim44-like domain-containing protein [Marinomonas mediterranea]ADZ92020.1 import inner membrane translocase subunit Tim44 [Marinomonas mediterranea MMB-1]WCN14037.1 TIM44-like domain-containing protein [Marinomonas mediterranea]WCN18096.1 TIM44-like domain-containing protein [Marinomonas mediterranea MMB-1]
MKTSLYAILMAFVLAIGGGFSADLQAKKLGGSKSFGKSYSVSKPSSSSNKSVNNTATNSTTKKKSGFLGGLGGGLLGGLLAGGLFAALMGSGAFDGISFGDILLFALIGFLIYKFFIAPKKRAAQQAQAAGHGAYREMPQDSFQPSPMAGGAGFGGQPEIQLPPGFNEQAFVAEAKNHYIALQKAWDDSNFETIQEYVSPELYNMLKEERAKLGADKPKTDVVSLMVDLVRGEFIGSTASISLQFSGWIKEGSETSETKEIWHLEKNMSDASSSWVIVGIQQDN